MGNSVARDTSTKSQLASIRIERLERREEKYIDQIHELKEAERQHLKEIEKLNWKIDNGISRTGYENLLKAKNKKSASKEQMKKFDKADSNNDQFLTFEELEHACD